MHLFACHSACMKAEEKFKYLNFLFSHHVSLRDWTHAISLHPKYLFLLNHVTNPKLMIFFLTRKFSANLCILDGVLDSGKVVSQEVGNEMCFPHPNRLWWGKGAFLMWCSWRACTLRLHSPCQPSSQDSPVAGMNKSLITLWETHLSNLLLSHRGLH